MLESAARSLAIAIFLLLAPAPHPVQAQTPATGLPSNPHFIHTTSTGDGDLPFPTTSRLPRRMEYSQASGREWTTIPISELMTQTSAPFCIHVAGPDHGMSDYCYCSNGVTTAPIPLTGQPVSDYQP